MLIDAHQHVWDLASARYDWLGPHLAPIDRDVELDEALPSMARAGVDATVLVQAADNADDTAQPARGRRPAAGGRRDRRVGSAEGSGCGRADARDPAARSAHRRRPERCIHDRPDPDWILRAEVDAGLAVLEAAGVPFDYVTSSPAALAAPARDLGAASEASASSIDHLGKPPIGG